MQMKRFAPVRSQAFRLRLMDRYGLILAPEISRARFDSIASLARESEREKASSPSSGNKVGVQCFTKLCKTLYLWAPPTPFKISSRREKSIFPHPRFAKTLQRTEKRRVIFIFMKRAERMHRLIRGNPSNPSFVNTVVAAVPFTNFILIIPNRGRI